MRKLFRQKQNCLLFVFAVVLFLMVANTVLAQSPRPSAMLSASPKPSIDYTFPYPGVLPDNALYKLKMVRDRIGAWLITDSLKKAEYFLKMGDKRIAAAKALAEYGKWDLSSITASKGEIYLLRSVEQAEAAKKNGRDVAAFLGKFLTASLKHEEVLTDMWGKAPDGPKQSFEKSAIITSDVYKKAQELLGIKLEATPSPTPVKK